MLKKVYKHVDEETCFKDIRDVDEAMVSWSGEHSHDRQVAIDKHRYAT